MLFCTILNLIYISLGFTLLFFFVNQTILKHPTKSKAQLINKPQIYSDQDNNVLFFDIICNLSSNLSSFVTSPSTESSLSS